jgi:hypothetical protein
MHSEPNNKSVYLVCSYNFWAQCSRTQYASLRKWLRMGLLEPQPIFASRSQHVARRHLYSRKKNRFASLSASPGTDIHHTPGKCHLNSILIQCSYARLENYATSAISSRKKRDTRIARRITVQLMMGLFQIKLVFRMGSMIQVQKTRSQSQSGKVRTRR